MADALCGPSNALQNFQKHTSVDRTLQQDRLTSRHSPTHGFRSSPGPNAGVLDPEFNAFQAGTVGPPQPDFHHFPPSLSQFGPPSQFAQPPQAPDWASDFQRLNIAPSHRPPIQQHDPPQVSSGAAAWHQDFMRQQSPMAQAPAYNHSTLGGISGYGMGGYARPTHKGVGMLNGAPLSEVAHGKQGYQEETPGFDEAAFERAFAQAQEDMIAEAGDIAAQKRLHDYQTQLRALEQQNEIHLKAFEQQNQRRLEEAQKQQDSMVATETDPVLLRIREKRLPIYTTIKLRTAIDLGRSAEALPFLDDLELSERTGHLTADADEAKWCVDALQKIVNREAPQEIKTRAENLIKAINERLMSSYPLLASSRVPVNQENIWKELEAAGYAGARHAQHERAEQQPQQKKEEQPLKNDDDEMAETAGRLLERVADNTSEKFQNSQFLGLMRRLRDREVRVDGDKMVEVSAQPSTSLSPATAPPEVDSKILDYAVQDFGMPVDSEQETNSATITSTPATTNDHIPASEQDFDIGRSGVPGLDPITTMHGHEPAIDGYILQ